jgi:hypothetical protein
MYTFLKYFGSVLSFDRSVGSWAFMLDIESMLLESAIVAASMGPACSAVWPSPLQNTPGSRQPEYHPVIERNKVRDMEGTVH